MLLHCSSPKLPAIVSNLRCNSPLSVDYAFGRHSCSSLPSQASLPLSSRSCGCNHEVVTLPTTPTGDPPFHCNSFFEGITCNHGCAHWELRLLLLLFSRHFHACNCSSCPPWSRLHGSSSSARVCTAFPCAITT